MNDLEVKRMEMFAKVTKFFNEYGASFQSNLTKKLFAELETVVEDLNEHSSTQITGSKTAQRKSFAKAALRSELREDMALISRISRAIALADPGFDKQFRMPPYESDEKLLSAARSFVTDAAPLTEEFVNREMPSDFLERLKANIELFKIAIAEKAQGRTVQTTASIAIDDAIERGMNVVRQLDPMVRVKFEDDPIALGAWLIASHTDRVPRSTTQPTAQPPTPQA